MKRKKIDGNLERQFLTAMITSTPFLATVAGTIELDLLDQTYVKQVASWCVEHFTRFAEAPGASIESKYHAWVENEKPSEDDADAVGDFLGAMSSQYDEAPEINVPYLAEELTTYLLFRKATKLRDQLDAHLSYGNKEDLLRSITDFRAPSVNGAAGYEPTTDKRVRKQAFAEPLESLIDFGGDAQEFLGGAFTRDTLIALQGPEKRGKTFWCLEFAFRALRSRKKIAMFQVGDLSEKQINMRIWARMAQATIKPSKPVKWPKDIKLVEGEGGQQEAEVDGDSRSFPVLTEQLVKRAQKRFNRKHKLNPDEKHFMVSVHANSSINVQGIHEILERWRFELGFVPDVIIIDYADILAPEDPKLEYRHQVNATWKRLRRLSQDWHACVIAPTQADAASYDVRTQKMKNFSEDKRKLSHVTGMLGLNQTAEEKGQGVMRLNWIVLREGEYSPDRCLWVAQCLALGQAMVVAKL